MSSPAASLRIDICVCTFRRTTLKETLRSLAALDMPAGYDIRVIVADNDDEPSARPIVESFAGETGLAVRYIHAPARNISIARNACLEACSTRFAAFLDDDEYATPSWLARLVDTALSTDADVVLGPVRAEYGPDAPDWIRNGHFHATMPVWVKDEIRTGYTCNVLLRMDAPSIAGRRFNIARGNTGGEDTEFFSDVHAAGGRIAYCPDGWVYETVPPERARMGWLVKRKFRMGQTHGTLLASRVAKRNLPLQLGLAFAKAGYCLAAAAVTGPWPLDRNRNLLRGIMHVGVLSGLVGVRELRTYGQQQAKGQDHAT